MPSSAALAVIEPAFTEAEKLALAGFLAGYSGMTREAYTLDLRQFTAWCHRRHLALFAARRADIELFARDLESAGRARATITRRLSTVAGRYRYAVEEDLLDHSPAAHVRRPRIDYESHTAGLDRNEIGALLVAAGLGTAAEHALISLLALNGLRVSEATGADIEALGTERGHRTWPLPAKAARKPSSRSPRAPPGRSTWPSAIAAKGRSSSLQPGSGWTGTEPDGSSAVSPGAPDWTRKSGPTCCAMRSSPLSSTPASHCGTSRKQPPTPTLAPPWVTTGPGSRWTGTPPTSSRPISQEPPGKQDGR
jgi:Phage integrase, N-terminal SAM-like domain